MKHTDLRPFISLVLGEATATKGQAAARKLVDTLKATLGKRDGISDVVEPQAIANDNGLHVGWLRYLEETQVPWTTAEEILDSTNHLAVVCVLDAQVALYASDPTLVRSVQRNFSTDKKSDFVKIAPARLNAAFVREPTVTLWLSGLHRRTETKVDNKVITGSNLKYALDPLNDQSYAFSAARSRLELTGKDPRTIGVAPGKSSVWLGPSDGWSSFSEAVRALFLAIPSPTKGNATPLPFLAVQIDPVSELPNVSGAFDANFASAEEFDAQATQEERDLIATWRDVRVEIEPRKGADFAMQIHWPHQGAFVHAAKIDVTLKAQSGQLETSFAWHAVLGGPADIAAAATKLVDALKQQPALLKAWYESGHVLDGGYLHKMQFREFDFDGYQPEDFAGYDVTKEKPSPLSTANIGTQDSLFCWVLKEWMPNGKKRDGWLACTDGPGEVADFVHLSSDRSTLTLIHAKGAGRGKPTRRVSVSSYEIVVSQAVKNLRHLDPEMLNGRFPDPVDARLQNAFWKGNKLVAKKTVLKEFAKVAASARKQVLILQPDARHSALFPATPGGKQEKLRAAQLHTLLLGAQQNCHSLNATFKVIIDKT